MPSLYDQYAEKMGRNSGLRGRNAARADIGMLLFAQRDDIRDLWVAADRLERQADPVARQALDAAVEKLRPLFGER